MSTTVAQDSPRPAFVVAGNLMPWLWAAAFAVTGIFGYGLTPWATIKQLLANQGVGDTETDMMWFAGLYTLPATAGVFVVVLLYVYGWLGRQPAYGQGLVVAGVFAGTAVLCQELALGAGVDLAAGQVVNGSGPFALLGYVLGAYVNTYGFGLFLTAVALGTVSALWAVRHLSSDETD